MKQVFTFIKAAAFFPKYTTIKNWKHKCAGSNGRGADLQFTDAERAEIKAGIKKMADDLTK